MHMHFLLYTQEPVFTNRAHIFMRWCLLWFSDFLCYIKARVRPTARQHSTLTGSLRMTENAIIWQWSSLLGNVEWVKSVSYWNVQGFSELNGKWNDSSSLCWSDELEAADFGFISVCVCALMRWYAYTMCVCICWRIREWDSRIHSLECEVCVLSNPRARNVS